MRAREVNRLDVISESTGEAWEKISLALLDSGEETSIENETVVEIRWLDTHVMRPLEEPRISKRFDKFCEKTNLEDAGKPEAYLLQVTKQVAEGYWWEVYGKPIWEQLPKLETILKRNPSYNKPSITIRNSRKHLGGKNTPCLVYLTFPIRNGKLDLGVHFDTNAIEYMQGNMYGLSELQRLVAEKIGMESGTYHHISDSVFVNKRHFLYLKETCKR